MYRSQCDLFKGQWFLKWSYQNEILHLETWYAEAFGMESARRATSSRFQEMHPFEVSLIKLSYALEKELPEQAAMSISPVLTAAEPDYESAPVWSMVYLGLGLLMGLAAPIVGLPFGIAGFFHAKNGLKYTDSKLAWVGITGNFLLSVSSFIFGLIRLISW